ncbi:kelch repeat and BTB domain-containing protein 7 [Denticeps clupeoides]|uniref:BTB domain-containing protein n=1 Tax=Denticeps clupeoides TaxID=299321 RepID=A0AAY4BB75_9TELE|nr:kelch repeat and BTB domain-containing protein 7-like [Denticeps clupeoides]
MASVSSFAGPEELEDANHARTLMKELKWLYDSRLLVDVTIEVEPGRQGALFPCNRNVLAAASPYFKSMFTGGLHESTQPRVTIHDVDADSMAVIVDYCYTGKVTVTEANVQRLYAAANMLQLEYIRGACASFMTRRLDVTNCTQVLKFADAFDNPELKAEAQAFIARNFNQMSGGAGGRDLCELDLGQISEVLSLDILDVDCERKVCSVALQWIDANAPDQTDAALRVLRCVRWQLLTDRDRDAPAVQRCFALMGDDGDVPPTRPQMAKQRIGEKAKDMVLFFGRPNEPFMCYDPYADETFSMASPFINPALHHAKRSPAETFLACSTPENKLYLASHLSTHFWRYDPIGDRWQELTARPLRRVRSHIGYLGGHVYVLGGRDPASEARLKEVECYSVQRDQWMLVAPLPRPPGRMQVVSAGGRLHAVGRRRMLCYDPKRDQWLHGGSLRRGKLHGACVYREQIVCLCDVPVVRAYCPARGEWRRMGDVPVDSGALSYQLVPHGRKLLLLTLAKHRLLVHEYDPARDGWRDVAAVFGSSFGSLSLSARVYPACLGSGRGFVSEEDEDSGSSADWDFDGLTDADSDSGSSSSFSDENW